MNRPKFLFGDIVVVDEDKIGVILEIWESALKGVFFYSVYVRSYNQTLDYDEDQIERYRVRHKCLSEEELEWQRG